MFQMLEPQLVSEPCLKPVGKTRRCDICRSLSVSASLSQHTLDGVMWRMLHGPSLCSDLSHRHLQISNTPSLNNAGTYQGWTSCIRCNVFTSLTTPLCAMAATCTPSMPPGPTAVDATAAPPAATGATCCSDTRACSSPGATLSTAGTGCRLRASEENPLRTSRRRICDSKLSKHE